MKKFLTAIVFLLIFGGGYWYFQNFVNQDSDQADYNRKVNIDNDDDVDEVVEDKFQVEVVAEDLEIPWELAFLPNGDILVTERSGSLLRLGEDRTAIEVEGVKHTGEGGLLGMVLHPEFESNSKIYLYLTTEADGQTINRVERYTLSDTALEDKETIIDNIPGASYHDGGRMEFGPDGYLYITTGDAGDENSAQDTTSLAGSILRLNDDGTVPEDNPFGNEIYSYGHRNAQGLAWDDEGRLWATEHGRSGIKSGFDELNLIEMGKNYGWPVIQGDETKENMITPVAHSGPTTTWAPAGLEYINVNLYFAGLRGSSLYEAVKNGDQISEIISHLKDEYGRLRAVRLGPDGYLYLTTSNRDGRGSVRSGDDKILRINVSNME